MIGKSDGPTAVFVIKRNSKLTLRQKLEKGKYKIKRAYVEQTMKAESHSLDEVIDYIVNVHGFIERNNDDDIDFHKFQISLGDINDNMYIIVEKRFAYIGGGVSGDKKEIRRFQRIFKDVHRYYGVTAEDIKNKTKRYEQVIRALTR